jgi:diguanylate cyclase (GGDEF)-like protein
MHDAREEGSATMTIRRRLDIYIGGAVLVAALLLASLVYSAIHDGLQMALLPVVVLATVLIIGELRPIRISHGDGSLDEVTISSSFSLALVLMGPLIAAVGAQAIATLLDDVRQRKDLRRIVFNQAQYIITLTASRLAYSAMTGRRFFQDNHALRAREIGAALAAAAVFFVVNHAITTVVIALSLGEDPLRRMPMDLRYHLSTSGVLLALAPVLVIAVDFSAVALPLLVLPIAAVHKSAKLAIQREEESLHDSLTGLPNRTMFHRTVTAMLAKASMTGSSTALMIVDLDHFKEINDTLGHHIGDQVIEATAMRLSAALGDDAMVCRLGGDEFAVLVPDTEPDAVLRAAHVALTALAAPLTADGVRIDVGASIGVAVAPEHGTSASTLLRRADVALYSAKEERNSVRLYSVDDDRNTVDRLELLGDLRGAIERGELVVHYQPKVAAHTGGVVGIEALARWEHPERGLIMPDDFIGLAEHTGLLSLLTASVLRTALADLRRWRTVQPNLTVAVNVAPAQLNDREFPESVWVALHRAGIPAAALTLEVTEGGVMASSGRVRQVLDDLQRMGVRLSIDDFGSGATSLSYLGRLPLSELKIDKAFVIGLHDPVNHAIVRSTIELGHNLGMEVVAEGVETLDVWQELQVLGCDVLQGYVIARPLTPLALTSSLSSGGPDFVNHLVPAQLYAHDYEAARAIVPIGRIAGSAAFGAALRAVPEPVSSDTDTALIAVPSNRP